MPDLLLINGPNLNLLGSSGTGRLRHATTLEPISNPGYSRYGTGDAGFDRLDAFQSNAEHEIVERMQAGGNGRYALHPAESRCITRTPASPCAMPCSPLRLPFLRNTPEQHVRPGIVQAPQLFQRHRCRLPYRAWRPGLRTGATRRNRKTGTPHAANVKGERKQWTYEKSKN